MKNIKITNLGMHDLVVTKPNTLERIVIESRKSVSFKVFDSDLNYYKFVNQLNGKLEILPDEPVKKPVKVTEPVKETVTGTQAAEVKEINEEEKPKKQVPRRRKVTL